MEKDKLRNLETEGSVIGLCINEGHLVRTALAMGVTQNSFTTPENAAIFDVLRDMSNKREDIDLVSVSARIPRMNLYMANLAASSITDVMFEQYCRDLKVLEGARGLCKNMDELLAMIDNNPFDVDGIIRKIDAARAEYIQTTAGHKVKMLPEALKELLEVLESPSDFTNIPILKGFGKSVFHKGETFIIGADTGAGKTAFAAGAVNQMLDSGFSVLYVCGESSSSDILARLASARSGVPHFKILNRTATKDEFARFGEAFSVMKQYHEKRLAFHCLGDGLGFTPSSIENSAKQLSAIAGSVDVIVIDYLGCVHPDVPARNGNKTQEVEQVINGLHDVFNELGAAGLVLCQYSRDGQKAAREGNDPQLNWLRDCGVIEDAAHAVAHIVRRKLSDGKTDECFLTCNQKHRNIQPFTVRMIWNGSTYEAAPEAAKADARDIPVDF